MRRTAAIIPTETSTHQQRDSFDEHLTAEVQAAIQRLEALHRTFMTESDVSDPESVAALEKAENLLREGWEMTEQMHQVSSKGEWLSYVEAVACRAYCEKVLVMATARDVFLEHTAAATGNPDAWDDE